MNYMHREVYWHLIQIFSVVSDNCDGPWLPEQHEKDIREVYGEAMKSRLFREFYKRVIVEHSIEDPTFVPFVPPLVRPKPKSQRRMPRA